MKSALALACGLVALVHCSSYGEDTAAPIMDAGVDAGVVEAGGPNLVEAGMMASSVDAAAASRFCGEARENQVGCADFEGADIRFTPVGLLGEATKIEDSTVGKQPHALAIATQVDGPQVGGGRSLVLSALQSGQTLTVTLNVQVDELEDELSGSDAHVTVVRVGLEGDDQAVSFGFIAPDVDPTRLQPELAIGEDGVHGPPSLERGKPHFVKLVATRMGSTIQVRGEVDDLEPLMLDPGVFAGEPTVFVGARWNSDKDHGRVVIDDVLVTLTQ